MTVDVASPHLCGSLYHRSLPEGVHFGDVLEMALAIEDVLDQVDGVQSPEFSEKSFSWGVEAGQLATFRLDILFRQHNSWQGRLIWLERGMESKFRSFLELILIMNDSLADEVA